MKIKWKFWERKYTYDQPFRRIYRGDVPFLTDTDTRRASRRKSGHTGSTTARQNDVDPEARPKPVRRQSISRDTPIRAGPLKPEKFTSNYIITSRYNAWNFLPKYLFEQFRRVVNFYFLVIALIQVNIDSPVHPVTAISPLAFVIFVSGVKQGYEDWLRHKNDDLVNNRTVKVVRDGKVEEVKSKHVVVGDIIRLDGDDQVPTDVLLLASSDEFLRCQINTANLDGETNLKLRYCPSGIPHFKTSQDFERLHVILECEHPTEDLYEFSGSLLIPCNKLNEMHWNETTVLDTSYSEQGSVEADKSLSDNDHIENLKSSALVRQGMTDFISIPLSMDNMVLRGTRLKNTDYIYGMVVYTGSDTRLARNSQKTEAKFSTLESQVNLYLMFFIGLLVLLVLFCSVMHYVVDWYGIDETPWYIGDRLGSAANAAWNTVASFIVLFNYIIPISLYVTVEMQKFLGSKFFVWDEDMIDEEGKVPLCNTSDLNEELGQIEYLFSDKTGTLTKNLMQFRHCSINALRYEYASGQLYTIEESDDDRNEGNEIEVDKMETVLHFFKVLALCHSVQVVPKRRQSFDLKETPKFPFRPKNLKKRKEEKKEGSNRRRSVITPDPTRSEPRVVFPRGDMEYQASSPDEKALLESCEQLGIIYMGEKEDILTLTVMGQTEMFKRLMHLEFDADRKCMSVIVENAKGEIWLYTKGAESSIVPKCDNGPCQETLKHVMDFALMGLRTLAVSERKLTRSEFDEFNTELRAARRLIKNRQEKVREVYSSLEAHMSLLGATGVEDQLQDDVPETLQAFAAAGIRVWMLTGDKLETGINVAISCGLITASTKQFIISKTSNALEIKQSLQQFKTEIDPNDNTCFVIDGESLAVAFRECPDLLRDVSMAALRVVCCRMAPLQKAQVVQMVKSSPLKPTCCAVGDGANDCAMIMAAHIGIGILGKEGRQAARCADFALAKFGYLRKAILVHGYWYYVRLANLSNYFFYKNLVFVFPQLFYSFHSNFSTQALFEGLFLTCFNIFFASVPVLIYGLTEQPHSADTLLKNPHLYKKNTKNALMNMKNFLPWIGSGIWHPIVCFYLTYFSWNSFQRTNEVESFGTSVFAGVVLVANCKMAVESKCISWLTVGSHFLSYFAFFVLVSIYSEIDMSPILAPNNYYHIFYRLLANINFWVLLLLIGAVAILPDLTMVITRHSWSPFTRHINSFVKDDTWLKLRRKSKPFPTLLFSKRSGSLQMSSVTIDSYLPKSNS